MKSIALKILMFFITLSCIKTKETQCTFIEHILIHESIIAYLHPELNERSTLYLVENNFCRINKKIGNIQIITIKREEVLKYKNYIEIQSIKFDKLEKKATISYPIEGVIFIIEATENNDIANVNIIEL